MLTLNFIPEKPHYTMSLPIRRLVEIVLNLTSDKKGKKVGKWFRDSMRGKKEL